MHMESEGLEERWALLSDPHLDANLAAVSRQGVNMAENFRRVLDEVLAEQKPLHGVIINGDCAHLKGRSGDYAALGKLLEPVREAGLRVHFTLGNHDDRAVFLEAFPSEKTNLVDGKQVSVLEGAVADWVFLDSLRGSNKVEGELGPAQLTWLRAHLEGSAAKPVILVGHHYPQVFRDDIIMAEPKIQIGGLIDGEEILRLVNRCPRAKVYVFGHSHDWGVSRASLDVHQVNLPPTSYVFRPSRPNGWVRAVVHPGGMMLELRALDSAHPEHGRKIELKWR